MAAMDTMNKSSIPTADWIEDLSENFEPESKMSSCLTADSDLYRRITQKQPVVLLTRINIDEIPHVNSHPLDNDDDDDVSFMSEFDTCSDSDEEWTEASLFKSRSRRQCMFCFSSYGRQSDLDKHVRIVHGGDCMPFTCDCCGRGFMKRESLLHHKKMSCKRNSNWITSQRANRAPGQTRLPHQGQASQHSASSYQSPATEKTMPILDLSQASENNPQQRISTKCKHCGAVYLSRTAMVRHYRSAHKDMPMPYSCHNCSLGFLDLKGLKIHLAKSRQFCARLVPARMGDKSVDRENASQARSGPSLYELPTFHSEDELLSYLREKTPSTERSVLTVCCPLCNTSITSADILDHLRHHKQVLQNCKKLNRFLCDVCLTDLESIELLIRHQRQSHGKSSLLTSHKHLDGEQSDFHDESADRAMENADKHQVADLDITSQVTQAESPKLAKRSLSFSVDDAKKTCNGDVHDVTIFSHCLDPVINLQNVIEIKPVSEENSTDDICSEPLSNTDAISGSAPTTQAKYPLPTTTEHQAKMNSDFHGSEMASSPEPPVLYPTLNSCTFFEESSCEMPDLSKESDLPGDTDDLIMVSDKKPAENKQHFITVKQEKDLGDFECQMQQPLENTCKVRKSLSERSFMDALIPSVDSLCPVSESDTDERTNITSVSQRSSLSVNESPVLGHGTRRNKHLLGSTLLDDGEQISNIENLSRATCQMDDKKHSSLNDSNCAPDLVQETPPRHASTDVKTWDSTESDFRVSDVKPVRDQLQNKVIVIDLNEESAVREFVASSTEAERSLHPEKCNTFLKMKEEDRMLSATAGHQETLSRGDVHDNKKVLPSSSSPDVITGCSSQKHEDAVEKEETTRLLEKQRALFEKLERFLSIVSDKPLVATELNSLTADSNSKATESARINGYNCHDTEERNKVRKHSRSLLNCDECDKSFPSVRLLSRHRRFVHVNQTPTTDSFCHKKNVKTSPPQQASSLKMRAYPCSRCGEYYPSLALLHDHKKIVHKLTSKYLCLHCDKSFSSRGQLQSHTRWKHTQARAKSLTAPSSVITKAMLKQGCLASSPSNLELCGIRSSSVNSQEKPKVVRELGTKNTGSSQTLQGGAPAPDYMCTMCGKTFINSDDRLRHEQRFCKMKDLSCGQCGKTFLSSSGLKKHSKTHQNIRYVCDVCGLAYLRMYSVKYHRQKQHPEALSVSIKWLKVDLNQLPSKVSRQINN